jgi:hypothetical protein
MQYRPPKKKSKIKNALATYSPRRAPIKALLPKALYGLFSGIMKALVYAYLLRLYYQNEVIEATCPETLSNA